MSLPPHDAARATAGTPRLLMLDLDDTLVARTPIFRAWAEEFVAAEGLPVDADWLVELDRAATRDRGQVHAALRDLGWNGSLEDVQGWGRQVASRYAVTEDGWSALHAAKDAGWRLAVVTNGWTERQQHKLQVTGLDGFVDAVCISEEVGVAKPDPLIFRTAAQRAGCTLEGAWMVGDNVGADIVGAHGVGVRAALVERPDDWLNAGATEEPDLTARDLADAVGQILSLRPAPASSRSS